MPRLDMGVYETGYALLALTTAFYDVLRQRTASFFDYPYHFAFLDVNEDGVATHGQRVQLALEALGSPWGTLDVWPESNWILASDTVAGMLKKVFDWQINRLFWPEDFLPGPGAAAFPDYMRKILHSRLKTVYPTFRTSLCNVRHFDVLPWVRDTLLTIRGERYARPPHIP